jgi:signal transduction histidine kinase
LTGLGLWFAYWCVDASGGEMDIETADDGSCVRLCMPPTE